MTPLLATGATTRLLQKVAEFGERRHEVLAANIAHIDTPGYQVRDLPVEQFQAALASYLHDVRHPLPAAVPGESVSPGEVPFQTPPALEDYFPPALFKSQKAEQTGITSLDGNNRNIEREAMELTTNLMQQQLAIGLLNHQMQQLEAVISERVV